MIYVEVWTQTDGVIVSAVKPRQKSTWCSRSCAWYIIILPSSFYWWQCLCFDSSFAHVWSTFVCPSISVNVIMDTILEFSTNQNAAFQCTIAYSTRDWHVLIGRWWGDHKQISKGDYELLRSTQEWEWNRHHPKAVSLVIIHFTTAECDTAL